MRTKFYSMFTSIPKIRCISANVLPVPVAMTRSTRFCPLAMTAGLKKATKSSATAASLRLKFALYAKTFAYIAAPKREVGRGAVK